METFEIQTAIRLIEFLIIQWAMAEVEGCGLFEYYGEYDPLLDDGGAFHVEDDHDTTSTEEEFDADEGASDLNDNEQSLEDEAAWDGGTRLDVYINGIWDDEEYVLSWKAKTLKMRRHPDLVIRYGLDVVAFLGRLSNKMIEALDEDPDEYELPIHTEHKRNGITFRGHPNYRGNGPRRD